ncbi:hypothetical protein NliqN6_3204 [Naganishia liquefaciens]|uniref:Eisosome component PIL1-domain-containing protein n=1 Tax=Naganishia liquefaciens TaxID=104408 RepID=A0A8H3YG25_9TREE|nr:hypothetical protein NliqN6_3204 [Naganishia liquefaciens]
MSRFLANLSEKAQASGLYKPANVNHPTGDTQGTSPTTHASGKNRFVAQFESNPTVANLTHQLRAFQQQHLNPLASPSTKSVQLAITAQKGIALDHDTLSRDLTLLAKEQDGWLRSLSPHGMPAVAEGTTSDTASIASATTAVDAALYEGESNTRLLDARTPLKELRNLQTEIEDRESKLRDTTKKHHKASSTTTAVDLEEQMERLQAEIKELSYGLKGKREDAAKFGQRKVWDSYEEAILSHAAHELIDMMPETTQVSEKIPTGVQQERVRGIEEGVRRSLGGLDGGWKISIDDNVLARQRSSSPRPLHTRSTSISRGTPSPSGTGRFVAPTIPQHVVDIEEKPVSANVIAPYPSSHLNDLNTELAPIPSTSPSAGLTAPKPTIHRHHSSFDRPLDQSPLYVPGADTSALSGSAVETGSPGRTQSPLHQSTTSNEPAQHPTVAETGIPIASHDPGPMTGQLERREPPREPEDIVKLGSFGGADGPRPSVGSPILASEKQTSMPGGYSTYDDHSGSTSQGVPPAYTSEQGHEQTSTSATHPVYAPLPAHQGSALPPPQHPATLAAHGHAQNPFTDSASAELQGMTPREQTEYQLKQKGYRQE